MSGAGRRWRRRSPQQMDEGVGGSGGARGGVGMGREGDGGVVSAITLSDRKRPITSSAALTSLYVMNTKVWRDFWEMFWADDFVSSVTPSLAD